MSGFDWGALDRKPPRKEGSDESEEQNSGAKTSANDQNASPSPRRAKSFPEVNDAVFQRQPAAEPERSRPAREPEPASEPEAPKKKTAPKQQPSEEKPKKLVQKQETAKPIAKTASSDLRDDDDDDDDDDEEDAEAAEKAQADAKNAPAVFKTTFKETFETNGVKGCLEHFLSLSSKALFSPATFFKYMPTEGGLIEPLCYLGIAVVTFSLFQAVGNLNPLQFFTALISSLAAVSLGAVVAHLIFSKIGGKGSFEATCRIFAFSKATLLFAWITAGKIPIGGILAGLYTIYLNYLGMERVHKLDRKNTIIILCILAAIGFALKLRIGG